MRFNFRVKLANLTFFAMVANTQRLEGVTSLQEDGSHIIMWDLEKCPLREAEKTLKKVQRKFRLSNIYITSDMKGSYRAWCYSKVDIKKYLEILLKTKFLDWNFFYWTVVRGKATLRASNKMNRPPQRIVSVLESFPALFPSSCQKVVYGTGLTKRGLTVLLGD